MERAALDGGAFNGLVKEAEVEVGVMANQDRARAAVFPHGPAYFAKYPMQRIALLDSWTQRMMRVNAINGQ